MINQRNRMLRLRSPLGNDACVVTAFSGADRISEPYRYQLTLLTKGRLLKAEDIVGVEVTLELLWGEFPRFFNGIVYSWSDMSADADGTHHYQLAIAPQMALLEFSRHNRIFENTSTVDIVKKLFADCGQQVDGSRLRQYARREICTQYSETDLDFINRLLAEDGISYFFRHEEEHCICVLVDAPSGFGNSRPSSCKYLPDSSESDHLHEAITAWNREIHMRNEKLTSVDYSEYSAAQPLTTTAVSRRDITRAGKGEIQLHGQHYFQRVSDVARSLDTDLLAAQLARWQAAFDGAADRITGASTIAGIGAGLRIAVEIDASEDPSRVLVIGVEHHATDGNRQRSVYQNRFVAVDATVGFVPGIGSARTRIAGTHTARVESVKDPASEGALGEVRVKFPWEPDQASCWARVAQLSAGSRWGSHFVPEPGQEVLVEFLNGDPDRPVVVGALYNRDNQPVPYTRTQSGIRSRSSNFNEMRFDDREGSEELFFQAGRDHRYRINNDEIGTISNNRSTTISNGSDDIVICNGNQNTDVAGNVTITAGQSITLQVGSSSIKLEPTCITLQSPVISLLGNAQVEVEAGAVVDITGGIVRINS